MTLTEHTDDERKAENPYRSPVEPGSPSPGAGSAAGCWRLYLSAAALAVLACISIFLAFSGRHFDRMVFQAGAMAIGCGGALLLALARRSGFVRIRVAGLILELTALGFLAWAWLRLP